MLQATWGYMITFVVFEAWTVVKAMDAKQLAGCVCM